MVSIGQVEMLFVNPSTELCSQLKDKTKINRILIEAGVGGFMGFTISGAGTAEAAMGLMQAEVDNRQ